MKTTPHGRCPKCQRTLSGTSTAVVGEVLPRPGDLSVCLYCSEPLVFLDDLTVRAMHPGEIEALDDVTRRHFEAAIAVATYFHARRSWRDAPLLKGRRS